MLINTIDSLAEKSQMKLSDRQTKGKKEKKEEVHNINLYLGLWFTSSSLRRCRVFGQFLRERNKARRTRDVLP